MLTSTFESEKCGVSFQKLTARTKTSSSIINIITFSLTVPGLEYGQGTAKPWLIHSSVLPSVISVTSGYCTDKTRSQPATLGFKLYMIRPICAFT